MKTTKGKSKRKSKVVKVLVIDRAHWLRGDGGASCLLNESGNKCCLGFYSLALGYSEEDILNIRQPGDVADGGLYPVWLVTESFPHICLASPCWELMSKNDATLYDDEEREQNVRDLFWESGKVRVRFVGKGEPRRTRR